MTAKKFIDDQWDIATYNAPSASTYEVADWRGKTERFRLRHFLFYASVVLILMAPIVWLLLGSWGPALIVTGISGLCFLVSSLLVPSKIYYVKPNEESH